MAILYMVMVLSSLLSESLSTASSESDLSFQPEGQGRVTSHGAETIHYSSSSGHIWPENTSPGVEIRRMLRKCSSSSKIQDLQNCTNKIDISLRLINNGKMKNETQYILVNTLHDEPTGELFHLLEPIVLQLRQEQVSLAYDFNFVKSVNSRPYEQVLTEENTPHFTGCTSDEDAERLCNDLSLETKYTPGPTGYCCPCVIKASGDDRHLECKSGDTKDPSVSSAHCLKRSPLWYSVNELAAPHVSHAVHVKVYKQLYTGEHGTTLQWYRVGDTDLVLGTDSKGHISQDRLVSGIYTKKYGTKQVPDIDHKTHYMLIPEPVYSTDQEEPDELEDRGKHYLVMSQKEVTLEGTHCDRAGVGYTGFLSQFDRCLHPLQSCLANQPRDFWIHDMQEDQSCRRDDVCENITSGSHLLSRRVHLSSPPLVYNKLSQSDRLHVVFDEDYVGVVDLQIDADEFVIIKPGSRIQIIQATTNPSLDETVQVSVLLRNAGLVTANITISVVECHPLQPLKSHRRRIHPAQEQLVSFEIQQMAAGRNNTCSVRVLDPGNLLSAKIDLWFVSDERCFCLTGCLCQCSSADSLTCERVSQATSRERGFHNNPKLWDMVLTPPKKSVTMAIDLDIIIIVGGLVVFGLMKGILGITVLPAVGMFGFNSCCPDGSVMPKSTMLTVNFLFCLLGPFLLVFWINQIIAARIKRQPTQEACSQREQQPLLPHTSWTEAVNRVNDVPPSNVPPPLVKPSPNKNEILDDYNKHKPAAMEELEMEEVKPLAAENEAPASEDKPGEQPAVEDIQALLVPGQAVFCHYTQSHPGLLHSGDSYSMCGQLQSINPGLYRFTIELNQTQVYEVRDGQSISLINLHPLDLDQFTRVLTEQEVIQLVSLQPREPCLNKVLVK